MNIRDLDDYELIQRWRNVRTDAALCPEYGPKRFLVAFVKSLEDEMALRVPPAEQAAEAPP